MKMTRFSLQMFDKCLPLFRVGFSLALLTLVASSIVCADEGAAVSDDNQAASSAAGSSSQNVVPGTSEDADAGTSEPWWKFRGVRNALSNGVETASIGGLKPRVRPHFHGDSSYNSNTTLGRSNSAAWQGRISPGITVDLPFNNRLFSTIDYTYSFSTTQGRRVHTHANTHNLDFLTRYDLSKKTVLGVRNNTQWSELPGRPGDVFFLETANPEIKHQFGSHLSTGLQYIYQHFIDVAARDAGTPADFFRGAISNDTFTDHGVTGTSEYKIGPNLGVGPSFSWRTRDFAKTPTKDYWQIQPQLDGTYTLGPKTKLSGHVGWAYRSFDVGDGYESELVYGAAVTHLMGRKFIWGLNYDKSLADTFDTGFVFQPVTSEASDLDNYDRRYRVLKSHRIGTTMTYNINEKNSVGIHGNFQFTKADANDNVFSNDRSNEKKMEVGGSYLYRLTKYIGLQLGYAFGRSFVARDNPSRSQYTFHKIIAGVNVSF